MHLFLMFVDTSIAYKKKHPLYLFVKSYISNVRYQMLFLTFYLFFSDVSYINCFMLLIFFQFILCTDQSFSGILSVVITILGRRYSHFLLEYFTERFVSASCSFPLEIRNSVKKSFGEIPRLFINIVYK